MNNITNYHIKRILSFILSVIISTGTFITTTFNDSNFQNRIGIKSLLPAYAAEKIDYKKAISLNSEAMFLNDHLINIKNSDDSNTIYLFPEPISYIDDNKQIRIKDISILNANNEIIKQGYDYTNGSNDYRINFSKQTATGVEVAFKDFSFSIIPQNSVKTTGSKSLIELFDEKFEVFEYKNIYGNGTSLRFYPELNGLKKEIIINQKNNQNTFSFELLTNNCTALLNDNNTISLLDRKGAIIQTLNTPFAYSSNYNEGATNRNYTHCNLSLQKENTNSQILTITIPNEWLNNKDTKYPITIDATANNSQANVINTCNFQNTDNKEYANSRCTLENYTEKLYTKFELPSEIKRGATINSAYQLQKLFSKKVTPVKVTGYLVNDSLPKTNDNQLEYNVDYTTDKKEINNYNSNSQSPNLYKFDIKNIVNQWINTDKNNNGIVFIGDGKDELITNLPFHTSKEYYSTLFCPYIIINYTNDTNAPTIDSVTESTTSWTNNSITLTVNNTKDDGSGLPSKPYSFSRIQGIYNWQSSNEKTISSNGKIYISVRDNNENIRTYTKTISNIDKVAPTCINVTGNPNDWTNNDITLSINGAIDKQSGLNQLAYSFSTRPNEYNWQKNSTKEFSENTSVYIYIRDVAGNVYSYENNPVVISKIDKASPTKPIITQDIESNGKVNLTANSVDFDSNIESYSFSTNPYRYHWQTDNTATFHKDTVVYICSKDKSGNISKKAGIVANAYELHEEEWVGNVTLTANSVNDIENLPDKPYSFSDNEDTYNWQSSNTKNVYRNGTYYIYSRDTSNNIFLLDTVEITNIDSIHPTISNINVDKTPTHSQITILATDNQSGIKDYSIDDGKTWQSSNIFIVPSDISCVEIAVRDNVNNITYKEETLYQINSFIENGKVCLYTENPYFTGDIYYMDCFENPRKYYGPITLPYEQTTIAVSYDYEHFCEMEIEISLEQPINKYTETNTDMSLKYNNIEYNIIREYDNGWVNSFSSNIIAEGTDLYRVTFPDLKERVFIKRNKYFYESSTGLETLTLCYSDDDETVIKYIAKYNNNNYHFNSNGQLIKIDNNFSTGFDFEYYNNEIIITDGALRNTSIEFLDSNYQYISSITDAMQGTIRYQYDANSFYLSKVYDQANVLINDYGTINNPKFNDKYVTLNNDGSIHRIDYINGAYTLYTYGQNTLDISYSNGKYEHRVYEDDYYHNLIESTDESEIITTYEYDYLENIIYIKEDENPIYHYAYGRNCINEDNYFKVEYDDGSYKFVTYCYDDLNRLIICFSSDGIINYIYDSNNRISFTASVKKELVGFYYPNGYDENYPNYDYTYYEYYNNGLLKKEYSSADNYILYQYDAYGNLSKMIEHTIDDDNNETLKISDYSYDALNRLISSTDNNNEIYYTYDAAGRILLTNTNGLYQRTVYDNYGRVVQELNDSEYDSNIDCLPATYPNSNIGKRYVYNNIGNLVRSISSANIITEYEYSDTGELYKKSFDIYDYFYTPIGELERVCVNGETKINYDYKTSDSTITLNNGQYLNKITYSNGYVEKQKFDKRNNLLSIYSDSHLFHLITDRTSDGYSYLDYGTLRRNIISSNENSYTYTLQDIYHRMLFNYSSVTDSDNNLTAINETHFSNSFQTVFNNDTYSYTSPTSTFTYCIDKNDNFITQTINNNGSNILSCTIEQVEGENRIQKTYDGIDISSYIEFDENGNISCDESNEFTYTSNGELESVTGNSNATYSYDNRGNMISKTVNGVTKTFHYDNEDWIDQLTAVDSLPLTYDSNGNLTSYNGKLYNWTHGKWLESGSANNNSFSYQYDYNGFRTTKRVNGYTTNYDILNGKILAQSDNTNKLYFQYSNDKLIGFILNNIQYYYITNINNDIVGITDSSGNIIARYIYDEWGKLLNIIPENSEDNNISAQQIEIATINPFRYRGYYYDCETGLYYLQSRYYDPDLCRFISADDFDYINTDNNLSINAYIYCNNNPLVYIDPYGKSFVSNIGKIIGKIITEIFVCLDLQTIASNYKLDFSFKNFKEYLNTKTKIYKEYFDILKDGLNTGLISKQANYASILTSTFDFMFSKKAPSIMSWMSYGSNIIDSFSGRYLSPTGSIIMALGQGVFSLTELVIVGSISYATIPFLGQIIGNIFNIATDKLFMKDIEYYAYNWYLIY